MRENRVGQRDRFKVRYMHGSIGTGNYLGIYDVCINAHHHRHITKIDSMQRVRYHDAEKGENNALITRTGIMMG